MRKAIVVGSGLAGLVCARDLARSGLAVTLVTAGRAGRDSASARVHALAPWILLTAPWVTGDSPARFLSDLKRRGAGLERHGLPEVLAGDARQAAEDLIGLLGLRPLDEGPVVLVGDDVARGRRCLPVSRRPVLAPLVDACRDGGVELAERTLAVALGVGEEGIGGVVLLDLASRITSWSPADVVVLACGGPASVFPLSTGPRWSVGSGLALAARTGTLLHRPHLVQLLPVVLAPAPYFPSTRLLLSGALTVGGQAQPRAASLGELAERVALAVRSGEPAVLRLPQSAAVPSRLRALGRTLPLGLAGHHGVGGVAIDAHGRTSVSGLYAAGEAAGGIQGAERTMGTGLIEAYIFGRRAAAAAARDDRRGERRPIGVPPVVWPGEAASLSRRLDELLARLAVIRPVGELSAAVGELEAWPAGDGPGPHDDVLVGLRRDAALALLSSSLVEHRAGILSTPRGEGG